VKIAADGKDSIERTVAVSKLADQTLLAKFAVEDKDWSVRYAAAKNLTDPAVLTKVTTQDEHVLVREAARNRLTKVLERKFDEQPQKTKGTTQ